jgi:hypothetical protein
LIFSEFVILGVIGSSAVFTARILPYNSSGVQMKSLHVKCSRVVFAFSTLQYKQNTCRSLYLEVDTRRSRPNVLQHHASHTTSHSITQHHTNTMDFAPYQDQSPETHRALSPPPAEGRRSFSPNVRSPKIRSPVLSPTNPPPPSTNPWAPISDAGTQAFGSGDIEGGREGRLNEFETSLPIRLDYEACLAYLLLPPAGGVLLLMFEQKSDYVRLVLPLLL